MNALTAAIAQRPVLFEEFGLCTDSPDQPSGYREIDNWDGTRRKQYFTSEGVARPITQRCCRRRFQKVKHWGRLPGALRDFTIASCGITHPAILSSTSVFSGSSARMDRSSRWQAGGLGFTKRKPTVQPRSKQVTLPVSVDEFYRASFVFTGDVREVWKDRAVTVPGSD